ncbi:hypothetical protein CLV63_11820 [Murinocardiopsis flavida]|uniref:DUF6286 domain-containing protein n=1 Tax=Murinocardiopsis flavida TaxID=645275 RepID=A0A2P8D4W9_9ACTN|nr:DUF6286 domain-containing protein [Murinocardiopsis flavida]PSK92263.1 hypothetical protein CLV63_11820 [Murinocardiopsis flavida]
MTTVEDAVRRPDPGTSRKARRTAVHTFRPRRSWPAFLVGAVVAVIAVLAATEVISALVGSPLRVVALDRAADYAGGARWNEPGVRIASAVLAVIGLVLLGLALVPGSGGHLPLRTDDPELVVGLSRPGLRRALAAAARDVDGVRHAHVRVGRRRVTVRATTHLRGAPGMRDAVGAAVQRRLAELDPLRTFTVRARITFSKA